MQQLIILGSLEQLGLGSRLHLQTRKKRCDESIESRQRRMRTQSAKKQREEEKQAESSKHVYIFTFDLNNDDS